MNHASITPQPSPGAGGLLEMSLKPLKLRIVIIIGDQAIIESGRVGRVSER